MNKFTKEELVLLACWSASRYVQVGNDLADDEGTIALSHKIQEMIVNYCEHTEEYEDFNYQPMRCKACLEITG